MFDDKHKNDHPDHSGTNSSDVYQGGAREEKMVLSDHRVGDVKQQTQNNSNCIKEVSEDDEWDNSDDYETDMH